MPCSLQREYTESDKRHVAFLLPLHLHLLTRSFSHGFALIGRHTRYLIYPSAAQRWGETRLQHCGFPMLILWSSRGWILAADAPVEHWITSHNISLSFHPPHPKLTPPFSSLFLPQRKPQNQHTSQPFTSRTNRKNAAPSLFFLSKCADDWVLSQPSRAEVQAVRLQQPQQQQKQQQQPPR